MVLVINVYQAENKMEIGITWSVFMSECFDLF